MRGDELTTRDPLTLDDALRLQDAIAVVGAGPVRHLYAAGFVVLDRIEAVRAGLAGLRRIDIATAASRQTGLPLREIHRMLDGDPAVPGVEAGAAHVDVIGCGSRGVVGAEQISADPQAPAAAPERPDHEDPGAGPVVPGGDLASHGDQGKPSDERKLRAYVVRLADCDASVVAAYTPAEAIAEALKVVNAIEPDAEPLSSADLEELDLVGDFEGVRQRPCDDEHDWGYSEELDYRKCFTCGTEEVRDEGHWGPA